MIENLKPYETYKESRVEWLGKVPTHWSTGRLKSLMSNVAEKDNNVLSHNKFIALEHIESWTGAINSTVLESDFCDVQQKCFRNGDILFGKLRPYLAKVSRPLFSGRCVGDFLVLRSHNGRLSGDYAEHMLRSKPAIDEIDSSTYGAKMPRAEWSFIGGVVVPCPPLSEQVTIAHFLDYATNQFDRLILANEKTIELLNEMKQVIIQEAVTGRIDVRTGKPYSKYKDSSVEWLGEIPNHWEVAPVKRYYHVQLGKMLQSQPMVNSDQEVSYLKARNIQWFNIRWNDLETMYANKNELLKYGIKVGDLLVCEGGEGGRCAVATKNESRSQCIFQNALHRVRPRNLKSPTNNHENEYLQYVLASVSSAGWFDVLCDKATIAHFTAEKFNRLNIPIPPFSERSAIVRYLDHITNQIEQAIHARTKNIELLKEYRTALIADVVTGKLDVSDAEKELRRVNNGM